MEKIKWKKSIRPINCGHKILRINVNCETWLWFELLLFHRILAVRHDCCSPMQAINKNLVPIYSPLITFNSVPKYEYNQIPMILNCCKFDMRKKSNNFFYAFLSTIDDDDDLHRKKEKLCTDFSFLAIRTNSCAGELQNRLYWH